MSPAISSRIAAMTALPVERQEGSAPGAGSIGETRAERCRFGSGLLPGCGRLSGAISCAG